MRFPRVLAFLYTLLGIVLCVAIHPAPVRAGTFGNAINVDFGPTGSPLYSGVAADSDDTGVIWNAAAPNPTTGAVTVSKLLDSNGKVTTASFTTAGFAAGGVTAVTAAGGTNPTANALLEDYLVGQTDTINIHFTGLIPLCSYDIYVYGAASDRGHGSTFQFGVEAATTNGAARGSTFVEGVNYTVLHANSAEDGELFLSSMNKTLPPIINGLQIQQTAKALTTFPSFEDVFDVSQGTKIIGGTATDTNYDLEDAIGGVFTQIPGFRGTNVIFEDFHPAGYVSNLIFQMPSVQTIRSINLFMNYDSYAPDGSPGSFYNRGASRVTFYAYDSATSAYDIKAFEIFPTSPYSATLAPVGSAVQDTGAPYVLAVTANISPVTTDRFKVEFEQAGDKYGVRVDEIDGFTTLNPGLSEPVPVITSATRAAGQVGVPFSYQLAASFTPTLYAATGLPAGLKLNPATGQITGTPTRAGTAYAAVSAANVSGIGPVATLAISIAAAAENIQGINFLNPPSDISVPAGHTVTLDALVTASAGKLARVQFIAKDSAGKATVLLTSTGTEARPETTWMPSAAGNYTLIVAATDTLGQTTTQSQPIHVLAATTAAPLISILTGTDDSPGSKQTFALGSSVEVVAAATDAAGHPISSVQFYCDGEPIPTTVAPAATVSAGTAGSADGGVHRQDASNGGPMLATGLIPLGSVEQLIIAVVTANGVTTVSPGVTIKAKAAPTDPATFVFNNVDKGGVLGNGSVMPAAVNINVAKAKSQFVTMQLYVDGQPLGGPANAPFTFALPRLAPGERVLSAVATDATGVSNLSPPVTVVSPDFPVVSVDVSGSPVQSGHGKAAVNFTIPAALPLPVTITYKIKGSAVAGTDYKMLSGSVMIPAGATKAKVKIKPRGDLEGASEKTVKLKLNAGTDYVLGDKTVAKVKIVP